MRVITRTFDDYANVIKAHELELLAGLPLRRIAIKYGLSYNYAHHVYKKLSISGEIKSKYVRQNKSKKFKTIENLLLTYPREKLKYIDIARQVKCSREYVRQIKEILIGEGKLKKKKTSLFDD